MMAFLSALTALVVTVAVLWPLRRLALGFGILDDPGPRKVHTDAVPYLGGLAMLGGLTAAMLWLHPQRWSVVVMLALIASIGLVDDIRYLPVWVKLVGEVAVACAAVALGFSWHITDSAGVNAGFSVLWMVGLTNSFNLLDNMDGLASTVAALSLVAIAALVPESAVLVAPLAGAAIGFLFINRPPAKMYMGDAGSLMLGFGVALCTIKAANSAHGLHSVALLILPVAVALFDTSLVIVSRLATGRPVQLGGKDHFSHRLRLIGWSPYQILGAAALGTVGAWVAAVLALRYPLSDAWLAVPIVVAFVVAWARLVRVDPYTITVRPALEVRSATGI
jgi:UDP-GlcNAc:undecaprenyl-phosphate/decaprenyl-phosphate GlcNAc-1-phosphate transferase